MRFRKDAQFLSGKHQAAIFGLHTSLEPQAIASMYQSIGQQSVQSPNYEAHQVENLGYLQHTDDLETLELLQCRDCRSLGSRTKVCRGAG